MNRDELTDGPKSDNGDDMAGGPRRGPGFIAKIRTYFLAGVVVAAPIGITIWLAWWFVSLFDTWIKPLIPAAYNPDTYLPISVPGTGLLIALIVITLIGALAANLFGRTVLAYWEHLFDRTPVVRNVYKALKQIFQTVLSQSHQTFRQVGLIQYPRPGIYAIVFISRDAVGEVPERANDGLLLSVFLPTTPNPTSGFLLFVPARDIKILSMSVEEAAKLIISAGLVIPEYKGSKAPSPDAVPAFSREAADALVERHGARRDERPEAENTKMREQSGAAE